MKTFHFETSFETWKRIQKCWQIIQNTIKNDKKHNSNNNNNINVDNDNSTETDSKVVSNCIKTLNEELFDRNSDNIDSDTANDISIESMNNLLSAIDKEMKENDNNSDNNNSVNKLKELESKYPSKGVEIIKSPV